MKKIRHIIRQTFNTVGFPFTTTVFYVNVFSRTYYYIKIKSCLFRTDFAYGHPGPFNPFILNAGWLDAAYMNYAWSDYFRQHQQQQVMQVPPSSAGPLPASVGCHDKGMAQSVLK